MFECEGMSSRADTGDYDVFGEQGSEDGEGVIHAKGEIRGRK